MTFDAERARAARHRAQLHRRATTPRTGRSPTPCPYTVVLVSLDEAPHLRVVGNIDGDVEIGMPVVPYWEERTAEDGTSVLLPQWRKARSEPGASRS